jgi:GntR family transcriptional regulator
MAGQAQIRIDMNSPEPVVRQIAAEIRTLIVEGTLQAGEQLPSVRRLATDLAVHFNTVAEAYRMLAEEGWLDVSHGRGARVIERQAPRASERTAASFREKLRHIIAEMRASGLPAARIRRELLSAIEVLEK